TLGDDLLATFIDFTERNAAKKELQRTSILLHEILNTIPIRVFWKDQDSNYLGCNLPFAQDAGLEKPEDIFGKTDYEVFLKEHADNFRADDRQVIQSGIPKIGFEEPQRNKEGYEHWLRTSKVPLKDKKGSIIGVLGTYEDISEKKQTENELTKHRENLEELVKERTRDLETKNKELDNAMKVFVGRELTIRQLQERLKALSKM
ncbi:MAG: PAS domain-containing protein, partial [Bacteroidales bacterium]|nr:PAS domain-containing protein [Bacteroidales bacterium]